MASRQERCKTERSRVDDEEGKCKNCFIFLNRLACVSATLTRVDLAQLNLAYEVLGDTHSRTKYDALYFRIYEQWQKYREYLHGLAEARRKAKEEREKKKQEELRKKQEEEARRRAEAERNRKRQEERQKKRAQEAHRRAEKERERKRQENLRNKTKEQIEADLRSAAAAAKYRQEQAKAASDRLRKLQQDEAERERKRQDERRRDRQRQADRRSAEAAAKYQQQQAAMAKERLRKLQQEEDHRKEEMKSHKENLQREADLRSAAAAARYQQEQATAAEERLRNLLQEEEKREKERLDEARKKKQKEADLRSAIATAKYRQEQATSAKERLRKMLQEERDGEEERGKQELIQVQTKMRDTERTYAEAVARCQQQEQASPASDGAPVDTNVELPILEAYREVSRQLLILRDIYLEERTYLQRYSFSSKWTHKAKVQWIRSKFKDNVHSWALQSRQVSGMPNLRRKKYQLLLKGCEQWIEWLEMLAVSPELARDADLDASLRTVYLTEGFHFPVPLRERARLLHSKWEMICWGTSQCRCGRVLELSTEACESK